MKIWSKYELNEHQRKAIGRKLGQTKPASHADAKAWLENATAADLAAAEQELWAEEQAQAAEALKAKDGAVPASTPPQPA